MSWSLTTSGSYAAVVQAVQDFAPQTDPEFVPDPKNPQADPNLQQAEGVKSLVINELHRNKDGATYSVGMSGSPGKYVSVSVSIS